MLTLRSRLRAELLGYFFLNPSRDHYLRELAALLDADAGNLSRELLRLEREGLFVSRERGRQKYFRLNRNYPLYEEWRGIVFKTVGAPGQLRHALGRLSGVEEAYLYGSFARNQQDASSDIDVLIIGRPDAEELAGALRALERKLGRQINYILLSPKEFKARRTSSDPFIKELWRQPKITLVAPHEETQTSTH